MNLIKKNFPPEATCVMNKIKTKKNIFWIPTFAGDSETLQALAKNTESVRNNFSPVAACVTNKIKKSGFLTAQKK